MKNASEAAALLEEIKTLMQLRGENVFKVRAFEKAAGIVASQEDLLERAKSGTLTEITGIGKGISEVLTEFLLTGKSKVRDEWVASLPAGLLELTQISGLGPKKAQQLIDELEIHSIAELEYACRENRLLNIKGFGVKVQAKILEGIQFLKSNQGQQRLVDAIGNAEALVSLLSQEVNQTHHPAAGRLRVFEIGEIRRKMETLQSLGFLIELPSGTQAAQNVQELAQKAVQKFKKQNEGVLPVHLNFAPTSLFGYELAKLSGTKEHWEALGSPQKTEVQTEEEFYRKLGLPWIPPEARETGEEVKLAKSGKIGQLLKYEGVQGIFHNHTTRSDGSATLEEMVIAAKGLGYKYIGISDHSQSAFYAQGLKPDILKEQEREIKEVQSKHPEIRIFWGIESDILADGSLDYEDKVLKKFDFVIASVHSRFNMDREAMTDRILEAVRNPYTRFLGHVTGRLLLGRKGYELDLERVIAEASEHDVAIEINSNPARLDIDWRWGPELRKNKTRVSINPDAHDVSGLEDTRFGIAMARKAMIPSSLVVNAQSVQEVEKWLKRG